MIIQGSSKPIVLEAYEEVVKSSVIHADLFYGDKQLKTWEKADMKIDHAGDIALPLTQAETLSFPEGNATIEIKWQGENYIECADVIPVFIAGRQCKEEI